jgi:hypothetical protein
MGALRCYVQLGILNMKLNVPEIPKGIPSEASLTDWVIKNTAVAAATGAECNENPRTHTKTET